jgi:hypothetical protein
MRLFIYKMQNSMLGLIIILALLQIAAYFGKYTYTIKRKNRSNLLIQVKLKRYK